MFGNEGCETVNLYLGPKSCYTASHCLNSISDISKSIFVDFKHNILQSSNDTENKFEKDVLWDENVCKLDASEESKETDCYSSNSDIPWSRIIKCNLNNKNSLKLNYCDQFSGYHSGYNFYSENNLSDDFEDIIRYNTEKCETLNGFTFVYDNNTGYGGFMSHLFSLLDDVYGHKAKLTFSMGNDRIPNIFDVECVTSHSVCSFFDWKKIPSYDNLLVKDTAYHKSALYSAALHQIYQMLGYSRVHLKDLTSFLSPLSRNLFSVSLGIPFDTMDDNKKFDHLFCKKNFETRIKHLTPYISKLDIPLHNTYITCCDIPTIGSTHNFYTSLTNLQQDHKFFTSSTKFSYSPNPMLVSPSYPQFFNDEILSNGKLRKNHEKCRTRAVESLPVAAVLQNSHPCSTLISEVLKEKLTVNKSVELQTASILEEDLADVRQTLYELLDSYNLG